MILVLLQLYNTHGIWSKMTVKVGLGDAKTESEKMPFYSPLLSMIRKRKTLHAWDINIKSQGPIVKF